MHAVPIAALLVLLAQSPTLEQRLTANPDDLTALSQLAVRTLRAARHSGEHEDLAAAQELFERWIAASPDSADAQAGLAYARLGRHDFAGALEAARAAARRQPESAALWALLGDTHYALGNYVEAEMAFRRLEEDGLTLQSRARMGLIHEVYGRFEEALTCFHEALEAGRLLEATAADLAWCHNMIGEMELHRGDLERSIAAFDRALQLDPDSRFAAHGRAGVLARRGQPKLAEAELRALVQRAGNPHYWVQLGEALEAQGQLEEARTWFAKAEADMLADLAAGELGHLRDLAELWLDHGGDAARAAELALRDLHEVRQDLGAFETAAWSLYRAGRTAEAVPLIAEALRFGGGEHELYRRAAEIYAAAGSQLQARRLLALESLRR